MCSTPCWCASTSGQPCLHWPVLVSLVIMAHQDVLICTDLCSCGDGTLGQPCVQRSVLMWRWRTRTSLCAASRTKKNWPLYCGSEGTSPTVIRYQPRISFFWDGRGGVGSRIVDHWRVHDINGKSENIHLGWRSMLACKSGLALPCPQHQCQQALSVELRSLEAFSCGDLTCPF